MSAYKIVRFYENGDRRTIERGLSLADVQAHCSSDEATSRKATSKAARRRTKLRGPWFDGWRKE